MGLDRAGILVIEDDAEIALLLETELAADGYRVTTAADGKTGLLAARQQAWDLLLLDLILPDMDGLEICRRLRQSSDIPIILLTARGDVGDRVAGFEAGANDYVVKPFFIEEVLARVRTQLRLAHPPEKLLLRFAGLELDTVSRTVRCQEQELSLTPKEYDLLLFLLRHPRQVLPRERLIEQVWGWDFDGDSSVLAFCIHNLRRKTEIHGQIRLIHTVHGIGYILREAAPSLARGADP